MPFFEVSSRGSDRLEPQRRLLTTAVRWMALAFALALAGAWGPTSLTSLFAQEPDDVSSFDTEVAPPPVERSAPEPSERQTNVFIRNAQAAGMVGAFIAILSLVAVGFIIEHFVTIRRARLMPEEVSMDLERLVDEGRIDEAIQYCERSGSESLLSNVVHAGLLRFRESEFGFADYKYAVEEAGEDETGRLYRKTEALGVIAAIAPMMGLLGTVSGMIGAFNTISEREGSASPDQLAGNIGEALVCTFMGLCVAVPSTVFFSFFRNKIDALVAAVGKRVERILSPLGRRR